MLLKGAAIAFLVKNTFLLGALIAASIVIAGDTGCSKQPAATPPGPFGTAPAVTTTIALANLDGNVDMIRDNHGMVHIYGESATDAMRVQGYQVAQDRTAQLELARRYAEGRMAELFGNLEPNLIDGDIAMRMLGLRRVAQQMYDALAPDSESRKWIDAFADGVSQFNARLQTGDESLPPSMVGIPTSAFTAWTGVDVLAVGRLQSQSLQFTADVDIARQELADRTHAAFPSGSRASMLKDVVRFAPFDPTLAMSGFPNDTSHTMSQTLPRRVGVPRDVMDRAAGWRHASAGIRDVFSRIGLTGSNNWVIGPKLSATGHAMVANDPHLMLSAPSVFWLTHLHVSSASDPSQNLDLAGTAFPGIPGVILGFNQNVAWGGTVVGYDVTDVYTEALTPDGTGVVFRGQNVPLQTVHETIDVAGGSSIAYDVLIVPHHGPLVPTIVNHKVVPPKGGSGALSVKWTGLQPTNESQTIAGFAHMKNVEDARTTMRAFGVGALNWVFGDSNGDIFYTTQSIVPKRDKRAFTGDPRLFRGNLPCFVLPGDGTAEWNGVLDEAYVPHVKNPSAGYVATSNSDPVGVTLDDDPSNDVLPTGEPIFLACSFEQGLRVGRTHKLIESVGHPISLDDMARFQADVRSPAGAALAPKLVDALTHAEQEVASAGSHPDLTALVASARYRTAPIAEIKDVLTRWGTESAYDAAAGVALDDGSPLADPKEADASKATLLFNVWIARMVSLVFDDELAVIGAQRLPVELRNALMYVMTADPTQLATYDPAMKDSALFDDVSTPNVVESRDECALSSLLDAIDLVTQRLGADRTKWRWGALHTLRFASLVPLWGALSIPPSNDPSFPNGFPRHGDFETVDVGQPSVRPKTWNDIDFMYVQGPTQRLVVDLDPASPVANNVLPGGEVWDNRSPHLRDEAELWRRNQNHPVPITHDDVLKAAEARILYQPR
jgi:penicillin amidase